VRIKDIHVSVSGHISSRKVDLYFLKIVPTIGSPGARHLFAGRVDVPRRAGAKVSFARELSLFIDHVPTWVSPQWEKHWRTLASSSSKASRVSLRQN
jgi:hypothetical protein